MMLLESLVTIFSGQWLWIKKLVFFLFRQYSFAISLLSPFEKGCDNSFRGSGNPLPDVPSVVKIGSVVIENEYYHFLNVSLHFCHYLLKRK